MGEHLVESESDNDGDSWTHVSSGESEFYALSEVALNTKGFVELFTCVG